MKRINMSAVSMLIDIGLSKNLNKTIRMCIRDNSSLDAASRDFIDTLHKAGIYRTEDGVRYTVSGVRKHITHVNFLLHLAK